MHVSARWRTASLMAGALLVGTIIGPPLAQAASAALVRIEGAHSTNVAAVSTTGQLSVAPASPADSVAVFSAPRCLAGGIFTVPAGKALIVTGANFYTMASTAGSPHFLSLLVGPAATPCEKLLTSSVATDTQVSQNQVFSPGIPVPAGDAVGLIGSNDTGTAQFFGYLVPAGAVPANILKNLPSGSAPTAKPPH